MITIKDSNVTIMVASMDASAAFYQSIGFTLKNRWGNHYAQLTANGLTIGLHPSENQVENSGNVSIGLTASDFNSARKELEILGIAFEERNEEGGQFVHFSDPDRNGIIFHQAKMVRENPD